MQRLRKAEERGFVDLGWLKSYHSFSFAEFYDPNWMHFRGLRVINQDYFLPNTGFSPHPHKDMEIVSYVIKGKLSHEDSFGHKATMGTGEIQRMSAGTGIVHSEWNHGPDPIEMLQIWILPGAKGIAPSYEQKSYANAANPNWILLASPQKDAGLVTLHTDVRIFRFAATTARSQRLDFAQGRYAWFQMVSGQIEVAGQTLGPGDGLGIAVAKDTTINSAAATELLVFDLA